LFFVKPGVKVNGQINGISYYNKMLDAIKHITDDIFSFRKIAHRCIVCVTQSN